MCVCSSVMLSYIVISYRQELALYKHLDNQQFKNDSLIVHIKQQVQVTTLFYTLYGMLVMVTQVV